MVSTRLRLSLLPLIGGLGLGTLIALVIGLMPSTLLERAVESSGVAALVAATQPPLGPFARVLLAGTAGLFVGATAWAALFLLFGPGGVFAREEREDGMPTVRRADAHPDAPTRRPLSAADLGTPPPPPGPCAERDLPRDLDQPLAAFDPAAIPAAPREPVRPVAPLIARPAPLAPGERISSVELSPRHAAETGAASIEVLLERLERGAARRQAMQRAG